MERVVVNVIKPVHHGVARMNKLVVLLLLMTGCPYLPYEAVDIYWHKDHCAVDNRYWCKGGESQCCKGCKRFEYVCPPIGYNNE